MRGAKKTRLTDFSTATTTNNNNKGRARNNSADSHPSSCCSSSDGSPRRRLELNDEGSQSASLVDVGSIRYDPGDHTTLFQHCAVSSHMMVLPRSLLNTVGDAELDGATTTTATTADSNNNNNNNNINNNLLNAGYAYREDVECQRSPSAAVGNACGITNASPGPAVDVSPAQPSGSRNNNNNMPFSPCGMSSSSSLRAGCNFVRLPHPRHGEPALFLCPPAEEEESTSPGKVLLYEVQAQSPPGGFGQTWFVNDTVEFNEELLVVTPFDITFFALRQVATHTKKDMFLSPEDLIMGVTKISGGGLCTWPGWGVALAQCPGLAPVVKAMQSHRVLSRICDEKSVGGDHYYRFSEERMGEWLRNKVQFVLNSHTLHAILQIPPPTRNEGNSSDNKSTVPADASAAASEVPLAFAFGVVAEYVLEELNKKAASVCGAES